MGRSPFLRETQGSFLFAVEVDAIPPDGTGFEVPCSSMSVVTDPYVFHQNARREINTATLTSVLKTYGGVRSFDLAQRNQQVRVDVFLVDAITHTILVVDFVTKDLSCRILRRSGRRCCLCYIGWASHVWHAPFPFRTRFSDSRMPSKFADG